MNTQTILITSLATMTAVGHPSCVRVVQNWVASLERTFYD
jgi:hypothetical protein